MTRERPQMEIYQDEQGGWRWRITTLRNGRIIGASTESYTERRGVVDNLRQLAEHFAAYHPDDDEGDPDSYERKCEE